MGRSTDEFPLLPALGLYAATIEGNGNCLFNALSDQIKGDQSHHHEIRARVIEYMREHGDYYKQFIEVNPGGGVRRNPKRKNAGAFSTPTSNVAPTQEEIDRVFEAHLAQMAKGGTYGDNMEIVAFSAAFGVDVKIYQREVAFMVSGSEEPLPGTAEKPIAHIAYHSWEHYSSIRNVVGPHTGLPNVTESFVSLEADQKAKRTLENTSVVAPWMIEVVKASLPYLVSDDGTVHRALVKAKGNVNNAVSELLENEERGSVSSTQGSSSVERDQDSDDDDYNGPKKKQDRRMSRATRSLKQKEDQYNRDLTHRPKKAMDITSSDGSKNLPELRINGTKSMTAPELDGDDDDDKYEPPEPTIEESPSLESPSAPHNSNVRLKLSQPKPENDGDSDWSAATSKSRSMSKPRSKILQDSQTPVKKQHRLSARDKKDMKKSTQKAAAKERKKGLAAVKQTATQGGTLSKTVKVPGRTSPTMGIKTLYI